MSAPRVLIGIGVPATVGFVSPLAAELRARGVEVALVLGADPDEDVDGSAFDTVFRVPSFRRASFPRLGSATAAMVRVVRAWRPDLLHLHTPFAIALGRVAARVTRTDHVAVVHGTLFDAPGRSGSTFRRVEERAARLTPLYVAVNHEDADQYHRLASSSEVLVAPCGGAGIDQVTLEAARDSQADGPAGGPASGSAQHVLVMGRFTQDKGLDLAIEAWERLRRSRPDIDIRFVGGTLAGEPPWTPPDRPGLQVGGFTPRPGHEIGSAALLLSCSGREGFSMVVAEALLLGTPVVAVTNRGTREIAAADVEGLTLAGPDPDELGRAMERALGSTASVPEHTRSRWSRQGVVAFHADLICRRLEVTSTGC